MGQMKYKPYKLNLKDIKNKIEKFNEIPIYLAGDYLTAKHFRIPDIKNAELTTASVVLIDSLWQTQLYRQKKDYGAIKEIIKKLEQNWNTRTNILGCFNNLNNSTIRDHPEAIQEAAERIFPIVLDATKYQNYSFATKLFHWYKPEHFPIVDRRSRKGISIFQNNRKIQKGMRIPKTMPTGDNIENRLNDYCRIIHFYSDILNFFKNNQVNDLLDFDSRTQKPIQLRIKNKILRILDKYFFMLGRE